MKKPKIRIKNAGSRHVLGLRGHNPKGAVLHTMDGITNLHGHLENWFNSSKSKGATHFGIGYSGQISNYVSDKYMLAANSNAQANRDYLSIEHADGGNPEVKRPEALYKASAELIAWLAYRYKWGKLELNKNVFIHRQFNKRKSCPGKLDYERIIRDANKLLDADKKSRLEATKPIVKPEVAANTEKPVTPEIKPSQPQIIDIIEIKPKMETTNDKMRNAALYSTGSVTFVTALVLLIATFVTLSELQISLLTLILTPIINTLAVYFKNKLV